MGDDIDRCITPMILQVRGRNVYKAREHHYYDVNNHTSTYHTFSVDTNAALVS